MAKPLPRATPLDRQVDPAAVLAFLDALEANSDIEMHSLMVVRGGHVVAEGWWTPYAADRRHLLYSLSKSFTSTAVAFAQSEGLLDLDEPVVSYFPDFEADITDPRSRSLTLRHLACMASGHTRDMLDEAFSRDPQEPVRGFLLLPPDREPGTVFAYSQPCTYTLASVVERQAGMTLAAYLRPRLFDPLGIEEVGWQSWPPGRSLGFTGLHARTEDVAKLGLLYLRRGRWGDSQLVPEEWVAQATTKQIDNPDEPNVDWRQGYGYQFWMARHGYRGDGAFGQFCVVLSEQDTVVATTARTEQMQAVLDALWAHLLPGLGRSSDDHPAQRELEARLRELRLAACTAAPTPVDWGPWTAGPFPVTRGVPGDGSHAALASVEVTRDDQGLELHLVEPDNALTVAVGTADWAVSEPVDRRGGLVPTAASGGWLDADTFRASVIFLETPHRLDLTLSLPRRTAVAVWPHPPLNTDRIEAMHCP